MTHQKRNIGSVSRLRSSVQAITTKLHHMTARKTHTARLKTASEEKKSQPRVLPPTTPPLPPPGALIAAQNWPEIPTIPRRNPQRTRNPVIGFRKEPARSTKSTGSVELGCITEDEAGDLEASSGSELSTVSMELESCSTDATSEGSLAEERDVTAEEGIAEKPDDRDPIFD